MVHPCRCGVVMAQRSGHSILMHREAREEQVFHDIAKRVSPLAYIIRVTTFVASAAAAAP